VWFRLFLVAILFSSTALRAESELAAEVETRIHALVNEMRAGHGMKPLEREARLDATGDYFSRYIAGTANLDHGADGSTPAMRVRQRGYGYCAIAENIAYEYSSRGFTAEGLARNFVEGWRESPTHRANMLSARFTQTGIGVARNAKNEYYAVQLFGRPVAAGAKKGAACPG
jgi:uncharacterized protein YkwD